jgi:hypothetical protein
MQATSNARAMIVQYWIVIPNREKSLSKKSKNSFKVGNRAKTILFLREAASVGGLFHFCGKIILPRATIAPDRRKRFKVIKGG